MSDLSLNFVNDRLLRRALQGNSLFSAASGVLALLAAPMIASFLGVSAAAPFIGFLGLGLIGYAALIAWQVSRPTLDRSFAVMAIVLDTLWVVGSFALLAANFAPFTDAGKWAILLTADVVGMFALIQYIGFRRMEK
jgi:membrane associated rhomboid family serine protease